MGHFWTGGQSVSVVFTYQHSTSKRDKRLRPQRYSNPRSRTYALDRTTSPIGQIMLIFSVICYVIIYIFYFMPSACVSISDSLVSDGRVYFVWKTVERSGHGPVWCTVPNVVWRTEANLTSSQDIGPSSWVFNLGPPQYEAGTRFAQRRHMVVNLQVRLNIQSNKNTVKASNEVQTLLMLFSLLLATFCGLSPRV